MTSPTSTSFTKCQLKADKPACGALRGRFLPLVLLAVAPLAAAPISATTVLAAPANQQVAQNQQIAQNQPRLTFPPASDCAFLGGEAGKRCDARRAGAESDYARVRSGETKMEPGVPSSSGGSFTPLSGGGSLGGFSSSGTIAPSGEAPAPSRSFSPNSIGNPWAGTPYGNGTGMMPR